MIKFKNFIIEKISEDDASGINELMIRNSNRFKRFFPNTLGQNLTFEKSKEFALLKSIEYNSKFEFTFVLKDENLKKIVGLIILKELDWDTNQGEFAYCIDIDHEGLGLITNAVKELSNFAFRSLGLETLQIIVHKANLGSVKVAKKCNFIWQKTLLNEFTPPNEESLDMELYELYKLEK